jgi:DNA-binding Lrp family transcriptional regulator
MYIEDRIHLLESKIKELQKIIEELQKADKKEDFKKLISTNEAAKLLGIKRGALLDRIRRGKVKAVKTDPQSSYSRYMVELDDLKGI